MGWFNSVEYKGRLINLLNLSMDSSTHTTKTFASLVIVARAVEHIKTTHENIIILTATSGNKGIALRSAVARAIELGLVDYRQLRVVIITPRSSAYKMRKSNLSEDEKLWQLNTILLYDGQDSTKLKQLTSDLQEQYYDEFSQKYNTKIWYSLNLDNYQIADSARAFFEYENLYDSVSRDDYRVRIHAHAVSSGYGFIGYQLGRTTLIEDGISHNRDNPSYFIIQHLNTPDLVLQWYHRSFDRNMMPQYQLDSSSGLFTQENNAHFPSKTFDVSEILDHTFYTTKPPTSDKVTVMMQRYGGGGIVVSLYECLEKYSTIKLMLEQAGVNIVSDPRGITEWSTIMTFTGVINAIDRGIIPEGAEITIHGTGYYARGIDYNPICEDRFPVINYGSSLSDIRKYLLPLGK